MVDAVNLHLIQYFEGIGKCFGNIREHIVHLLAGLEPFLLGIAHTVRVVEILAGSDTEQMVVSLGSLLILEVAVVGAHQFDVKLPCHLDKFLVGTLLQLVSLAIGKQTWVIGHFMALELEIVIVAKEVVVPLASLAGSFQVTMQNLGWHLACNTCRTDDEVFMILLQIGTVGSWAHVVTIHPRIAHQLDEVLVSIIILGKYNEVITAHIALILLSVGFGSACHIHLAAYDRLERFESLLLAVFINLAAIVGEFLDAEHHTVVGYRHTLHAVLDGLIYQMRYLRLAVEDGVLGVYMQMNKIFHYLFKIRILTTKLRRNIEKAKRNMRKY